MRDVELYRALLGLTAPWTVVGVDVDLPGSRWWCGSTPARGRTRARSVQRRGRGMTASLAAGGT